MEHAEPEELARRIRAKRGVALTFFVGRRSYRMSGPANALALEPPAAVRAGHSKSEPAMLSPVIRT